MSLKERISIYVNAEARLKATYLEKEAVEKTVEAKRRELKEMDDALSKKRGELELLRTEVFTLKKFIDNKFEKQLQKYDYKVDITNCYIIDLEGKKYIALRTHRSVQHDLYTLLNGYLHTEIYQYYDVLNIDNHQKYKPLTKFSIRHHDFDGGKFSPSIVGIPPVCEVSLIKAYPELICFSDSHVPNTYLKKIYYEINELGNNPFIKKMI